MAVGVGAAALREKVDTPPLVPLQLATATVSPRMAIPVAPASATVFAAVVPPLASVSGVYIRTPSENVAQRFPSASKAAARAPETLTPVSLAWSTRSCVSV